MEPWSSMMEHGIFSSVSLPVVLLLFHLFTSLIPYVDVYINKMNKTKQIRNQKPGSQNPPGNASSIKEKRPFDKAKWREQKYSNKAKLNRFEDRRQKAILHNYYKELKKSGSLNSGPHNLGSTSKSSNKNERRLLPHELAKREFERIAKEKEQKRIERERAREERKAALQKYNEKKKDRFRKLSKKTQKGQPVMAGRMELLLQKIQNSS